MKLFLFIRVNPPHPRRPASPLCFLLVLALVGCSDDSPAPSSRSKSSLNAGSMTQSAALFDSVLAQLRTLPETVALNLTPPQVLLDARTSSDGKDLKATVSVAPNAEVPLVNFLTVTTGNGRFQTLKVRPGDIVKYYVQVDDDTRERLRESLGVLANKPNPTPDELVIIDQAWANLDPATIKYTALDMVVAQVLSEQTLIVEQGLTTPSQQPVLTEIWRNTDDRMTDISARLAAYANRREPAFGWEPTPDEFALRQMVERTNQWLRQRPPTPGWKPAALLATLPVELAKQAPLDQLLTPQSLQSGPVNPWEGRLLQEALWLRDISNWSRGREPAPLVQATQLFDWTVRNLTLIENATALPRRPWQLLLHGKATAAGRAWVFAELCRQQRLASVVLELTVAEGQPPWLWCGVAVGNDLALFDPQLGLPVPGEAEGAVATLSAVTKSPELLKQCDRPDFPYPVTAEVLKKAQAFAPADLFALTHRAAAIQQRLVGDDALILAVEVDATTKQLEETIKMPIALWSEPFRILTAQHTLDESSRKQEVLAILPYAWRPVLWKARLLAFRGRTQQVGRNVKDALAEDQHDHRAAQQLLLSPTARPSDARLAQITSPEKLTIYREAKRAATYWLGMLQFDEGRYPLSAEWLENSALTSADGEAWAEGASYNRARALEAAGNLPAAIALLEADKSPQRRGNQLRAARLRTKAEEKPMAEAAP